MGPRQPQSWSFVATWDQGNHKAGALWPRGGRYDDPQLARFQNPDPTGIASGDANLYRYVANDPVNRRDPSGNQDPEIIPLNPTKAQYDRWVKEGMVTRYEGWTTDYYLVRLNGRKYVYQENTFSGVGVLLAQHDMAVDDADAFKSAFGKTISSTSTYSEAVGKGLQTSVKAARNAATDTAVGLGTLGSYSGADLRVSASTSLRCCQRETHPTQTKKKRASNARHAYCW